MSLYLKVYPKVLHILQLLDSLLLVLVVCELEHTCWGVVLYFVAAYWLTQKSDLFTHISQNDIVFLVFTCRCLVW